MSDLTIVLRSLQTRLSSSVIVVVLVAISAGLLLTILSLKSAGERTFTRGTGNVHMLVSNDGSPLDSVLNGLFYANPPRGPISEERLAALKQSFPWSMFIPTAVGDSYEGFPVVATVPGFLTEFDPVGDGSGWTFAEGRNFEKNFEVVLGAAMARETRLRIGSRILLTHGSGKSREGIDDHGHVHKEYEFEVVGILEPTMTAHDRALFTNLESSWILHAHDRFERDHVHKTVTAADLVPEDRLVTGVLIRLPSRDPRSAPPALISQYERLRRDPTVTVAQPANEIQRLLSIVWSVDILFVAMAAATLISAGVAIFLSMINSMGERRRQVAILRVLGASRPRIFWLVLTESTLVGLVGSVIGAFLAAVLLVVVTRWLGDAYGLAIESKVEPRLAIIVAMGTTLLAAAAGLVPAILAYRTGVARNLRPIG
jgi:putative ABC transport system permease protein